MALLGDVPNVSRPRLIVSYFNGCIIFNLERARNVECAATVGCASDVRPLLSDGVKREESQVKYCTEKRPHLKTRILTSAGLIADGRGVAGEGIFPSGTLVASGGK